MEYDQDQDQDWESATFGLAPLFGDDQLDQSQSYALDPPANHFATMPNPFATMASLQGNFAGADVTMDSRMMPAAPIYRYVQNKDEPWHAHRDPDGSVPLSVDTALLQQYREPAPSDAASSVAGAPDSGYVTRPYTYSTGSAEEPSTFNRDCPAIETPMKEMKALRKTSSVSSRLSVPYASDQRHSRKLSVRGDPAAAALLPCEVKGCGRTFKLASELKKHNLRHQKPFRCPITTCDRFLDGFTTTNDLDRHKVTKHQIFSGDTKAWRCAIHACRSRQKLWYRLDNFRQHIWRTHSKRVDDIDRIAARSALTIPHSSSAQPPQGSAMTAPDSMPEGDASPDQSFDGSGLPDYSVMPDGSLMNVQNNDWPTFASSSSAFGDDSNDAAFHNSYRSFSDAGSAPFDRSSYIPAQLTSSTSYPTESTLNEPAFASRSMSPGQSPWLSPATASSNISQRQQQQQPQAGPKRFATSSQPKVVVHHADSDSVRNQAADDFLASAKAIVDQGLPDDQLYETLSTLSHLLESRKTQTIGQRPRSNENEPGSREMSLSPSRGRTTIRAANPVYVGHGKSSASERAMSHSSDRSQTGSMRGRSLHQNDALTNTRSINCPEPDCPKTFDRRSALDKHIRRHQKPYACTFDACPCSKAFGSKNDWKRHENSQHMQPDLWRCDECAETFQFKRSFTVHLQQAHGVGDRESQSALCKKARIGVNHSGSFWCGFCPKIIAVDGTKKGAMVWDERFNHIANHFVPEQRKIEDWLPPSGRETKGQREAAAARVARGPYFVHQQPVASDTGVEGSSYSPTIAVDEPLSYGSADMDASAEPAASDASGAFLRRGSSKRKRKDTDRDKGKRQDIHRECHLCFETYAFKISTSCVECGHEFCGKCRALEL